MNLWERLSQWVQLAPRWLVIVTLLGGISGIGGLGILGYRALTIGADPVNTASTESATPLAALPSATPIETTSEAIPVPSATTPTKSTTATPSPTKTTAAPASESTPSPSASATPTHTESSTSTPSATPSATETSSSPTPTATCSSDTNPDFTAHITDTSKIAIVIPPATFAGTALKTHSFLDTQLNRVPVYAPTTAKLTSGAYYQEGNPGGEYILTFEVSCEVDFRVDHITEPIQSIRDAFPGTPKSNTQGDTPSATITLAAGDLIGYTTGTLNGIWDFGVYNSSTSNAYASNASWNTSDVYTTAVCPYDYFSSSMRAIYSAKFGYFGSTTADVKFCGN